MMRVYLRQNLGLYKVQTSAATTSKKKTLLNETKNEDIYVFTYNLVESHQLNKLQHPQQLNALNGNRKNLFLACSIEIKRRRRQQQVTSGSKPGKIFRFDCYIFIISLQLKD